MTEQSHPTQQQSVRQIACDACGESAVLAPKGPTLLKHAMPRGWMLRRIDGRGYILCAVCGNIRHFVGGLSFYLQDRLKLPQRVEFEAPEFDYDFPDDWFRKKRP